MKRKICSRCNSTEVIMLSAKEWDENLQATAAVKDFGWCRVCSSSTLIEELTFEDKYHD